MPYSASSPVLLGPDLAAIEELTPADSDIIQRVLGEWTNRTPAQLTGLYTGGGGDINIADTNYVTIGSQSFVIVAGDKFILEAEIIVLNNSAAVRTYTIGAFVGSFGIDLIESATIAASATNRAYFTLRAAFEIRASNLAYCAAVYDRFGPAAANTVSNEVLAQHKGAWNSSASNFTGTQTVKVAIKSSAATVTQTGHVLGWRIQKC